MTAADRVCETIKSGILNGVHRSGGFIREAVIAKQLNVSRTPIREAIRQLVSEGWLELIPNRGARVVRWTNADVDEVFDVRALLEPLVVRRAANCLSPAQIDHLEELASEMETLAKAGVSSAEVRLTDLNQALHGLLIEAAASPRIQHILQIMTVVPVARRSFHNYTKSELDRSMTQHRELIDALKAGDGEWAASVMRTHILAARAVHLRATSAEGPSRIKRQEETSETA